MRVLLTQLDGKMPNLALMKLSHWHKARGDEVVFTRNVERREGEDEPDTGDLFADEYDTVYGSAIFKFSQIRLMKFMRRYPHAIVGGTGTLDTKLNVESVIGGEYEHYDYSLYPDTTYSLGFTQRGCRLRCGWCVVPEKEGKPRSVNTVPQLWRGDPWPRHLHILDNDFFFDLDVAAARVSEMRAGGYKVALTQGINCRMISDDAAAMIASIDYRDDEFDRKRLYTAWDSLHDEKRLLRGLELLAKHGVKPEHIMVYMLIGYRKDETEADWLHRQSTLRAFGARPYPMPFVRTPETVGFQRWCIRAYDKNWSWEKFKAAKYQPANLGEREDPQ